MTTYLNGQQYYHPMTPQPGSPQMQQAADQRYAALRLQQAVRAGVIGPEVLNAHPNTYPALWRMVSQKIAAPAAAAGYKDPGYWLRQGGGVVGGQGGVDTSQVPQEANPIGGSDVIERFIANLQNTGAQPQHPMPGGLNPQLLAQLYAQFQATQGGPNPNVQPYGNSIT